jgi:competence protein ComEC
MDMMHGNSVRIKGQLFFFAGISLLGCLSIFESHFIYGGLFLLTILIIQKLKKFPAAFLMLLILCYLIYVAAGYYDKVHFTSQLSGNEKNLTVVFDNEIKIDGDHLFAYAHVLPADDKVVISYRIKTSKEQVMINNMLLPGTACKAAGSLKTPSKARNPHAFNYQSFLKRKDITWIYNVDHFSFEQCTNQSSGILTNLNSFRQKEVSSIKDFFPKETAALSAALLFGDRGLFNPETERSYQKIGVVHLLAISGLHVGLLVGMVFYVFIWSGITKEKTEWIMLMVLPLYAVVTGLAPPVVRAVVMMMLLIGARRFHLRLTPLDAISLAFMLMLLSEPLIIYDIGFQLSFSVSFSLVISSRKILTSFESLIQQTAAASFIAQLSSLPVILTSFYEVSLISIIANLLFVPLFSFILLPVLMLTYIVFSLSGSLPRIYVTMLDGVIRHINKFSNILAEIPISTVIVGKPTTSILIFVIIMVPLFFILWERFIAKRIKPPFWIFVLPIIPVLLQMVFPYLTPYGKIIFIDVGQGDSILIRMPYNKGVYLIDTGGVMSFEREGWKDRKSVFDPGKDIVLPVLKSEGMSKIDKLILTHGDADHIGGAVSLFGEIKVKQLILPRETERSALEKKIIDLAAKSGTDIFPGGAGTGWESSYGDFEILNPTGNAGERNERSIVLLAKIGGKKWLFTGDLGFEGEQTFVDRYGKVDIDVLKVGHHGSKYSSSVLFLEHLDPEYAVISVGAQNRYGHPGREVIDSLKEKGVRTFRTDVNGAVIYRFKGNSGTFFTQMP